MFYLNKSTNSLRDKPFAKQYQFSKLLIFCSFYIVRCSKELEKAVFRNNYLFPSSGEEADTYILGPLRRVNVIQWATHVDLWENFHVLDIHKAKNVFPFAGMSAAFAVNN
jgi:hypothetical protein